MSDEQLRLPGPSPPAATDQLATAAALRQQGKLGEALTLLEEAARSQPACAEAQNALGSVLIECHETGRALRHLREAIRLRGDFVDAQKNLGLALQNANRLDEARACFREALRIDPGFAQARNCLADALAAQGDIDAARATLQEALKHDPHDVGAIARICNLAAAGLCDLHDHQIRCYQQLAARADLTLGSQCQLRFALAQVFDATGNYDEAFEQLRLANAGRKELLRQRGVIFDPAALRQSVDRTIATFTPAYFEGVRSFGSQSPLPVFIVGMMRSGTTLAEQILASHPLVHGAGELLDFHQIASVLSQRLSVQDDYPECLARLNGPTARVLAEAHVKRLSRLGDKAARVVDKMPFNFMVLGIIATLLPRASIIHCRRHPVDTCLSCYFQDFAFPNAHAFDLRALGHYYREYERLMTHWAAVLPIAMLELRYEELTAEPDAVSRRLVAFCGLDWDDRCLRFNENARAVWTASSLQVRRPIYQSAVGRWKRYEAHLKPLLEALELGQ